MDEALIRARCREMRTEELVREVLLLGEDYRPEALAIYREALESRLGDVQRYLQSEQEATGEERLRVTISDFYQSDPVASSPDELRHMSGELICTTRGLGFLPSGRSELISFGGLGGYWMDLLDEVNSASAVAGAHRALPLSLLAKAYKTAFYGARDEVSSVSIMGTRIRITLKQGGWAGGELQGSVQPLLSWGEELLLRMEYRENPPTLWEMIKGIFRKS